MVNSFLGQDHPLNLKSAWTDCLSDLRCGPDLILDIASKMELVCLSCFSKAIVLLSLWKTSETLLTCWMMSKRKGSNLHNRPRGMVLSIQDESVGLLYQGMGLSRLSIQHLKDFLVLSWLVVLHLPWLPCHQAASSWKYHITGRSARHSSV